MARPADVILSVAAGGGVGSVARYVFARTMQDHFGSTFPVGTFAVNLLGCLILGFLMRIVLDTGEFSPTTRALLTTGFCGGFTTFSTFAWEATALIEEGSLRRAAAYVSGNVVAGLAGIWLGTAAARLPLSAVRREPA
jgi:fluoride exporter